MVHRVWLLRYVQTSSPTSSRSLLLSSLLTLFADTACTTPSWLYISSVLADRNQTTDCFPATQGITFKQSSEQPTTRTITIDTNKNMNSYLFLYKGSIQGECDFTKSPISYYATKFTDAECATPSVVAAVSSSYCLSGSSASYLYCHFLFFSVSSPSFYIIFDTIRSILSCGISSQRKITNVHASGLVLVAGYSYFSSSKCSKSTFYHAELAPIAACPKTYPRKYLYLSSRSLPLSLPSPPLPSPPLPSPLLSFLPPSYLHLTDSLCSSRQNSQQVLCCQEWWSELGLWTSQGRVGWDQLHHLKERWE